MLKWQGECCAMLAVQMVGHQSFPCCSFIKPQMLICRLIHPPQSDAERWLFRITYLCVCVDNFIRHSETALSSLRLQKFRLRSALSLLSQGVEAADCEREHLRCQHSTALKGRPLEASSPLCVPPVKPQPFRPAYSSSSPWKKN